jgi:chromosome segregation ATPase
MGAWVGRVSGAAARAAGLVLSGGRHGIVSSMTDLTLEILRAELAPLRAQLGDLEANVSGLDAKVSGLDAKVSGLDAKVAPIRAQLDGLPLISRSLTVLQQETGALRAAFNDFARTNVTAGEIEALHADVNRVQAENAEMQTRLATVERLLEELQRERP